MQGTNVHVTNVAPGLVVTGVGVNALRGDGTKFGVSDKLIASGMSVQRWALCNSYVYVPKYTHTHTHLPVQSLHNYVATG